MKGFNFNLEKVLNVRNIQEDIAQNQFQEAKQKKMKMKNQLNSLHQTEKKTYDFIREEKSSSVDMTLQARRFLHLHKQKIKEQQKRLSSQKEVVAKKQKEVIAKQKKRKVLDKLKEKKYKKFYKEHLKNKQKELDEIGQRLKIEEKG